MPRTNGYSGLVRTKILINNLPLQLYISEPRTAFYIKLHNELNRDVIRTIAVLLLSLLLLTFIL